MKTDLEQVKAKARMLLYTDVHLTEFSPLVVQHPFTKSGYVGVRQDHKVQILNIAENEDGLRRWRVYVAICTYIPASCTDTPLKT